MEPRNSALVTIAIPTFNRSALLARAVASARAQDYANIEILIIDNASDDSTQADCRILSCVDERIRYIRQPRNLGAPRNFETGITLARGHFFMWLADDDSISPNYVQACKNSLVQGSHSVVVGLDYVVDDGDAVLQPVVQRLEGSIERRILNYLEVVSSNAATYGVTYTSLAKAALPFPTYLGGDWVWVLSLLSHGTLATESSASIYLTAGGVSSNLHRLAVSLGHAPLVARFPRVLLAVNIARGVRSRVCLSDHSSRKGWSLALRAGLMVFVRFDAISDVTGPPRSYLRDRLPRCYLLLRSPYSIVRRVQRWVRPMILAGLRGSRVAPPDNSALGVELKA